MKINSDSELAYIRNRIASLQRLIASTRVRLAPAPSTLVHIVALQERQLEQLQNDVREYLGVNSKASSAIELSFDTDDGDAGTATLKTLEDAVTALRGALTSIAYTLVKGSRIRSRPPDQVANAVNLRVVGVGLGSFRLLLEYPNLAVEEQADSEVAEDIVDRTISVLEQAVKWVDSESPAPPSELADEKLRNVALAEVRRLAAVPGGSMRWLEIRRAAVPGSEVARFTATTATRASRIIESRLTEETLSLSGRLRAIDLDSQDFQLTDWNDQRHPCKFEEGLMLDALQYILTQQPVVVRGVRRGKSLHVSVLEQGREPEPAK